MTRFLALLPLLAIGCNEPLVEVDTTGTNAFAAYENARGTRVESFYFGGDASNAVVDYVFVLDNSVSMRGILQRVKQGFRSLDKDAWPADARIAVLSTLPHAYGDVDALHPIVERLAPRAIHDPGFTQFVSKGSIAAHNQAVPELAKRFKAVGCDEWFSPDQKGADGITCIQAHTQIALDMVGAEAGLTALSQLLDRNAGSPTFRPGASVNVVFVSDTHDPGAGRADSSLMLNRPTADELVRQITRDNSVSSVRFHAIAPRTECVEPWKAYGPSYFDAAEATGGKVLDACTAKDYRPILNAVLVDGARPTQPVFGLGAAPDTVDQVTVDGASVPWKVDPRGTVVVDVQPAPDNDTQVVEITYQKLPTPVTAKTVKPTRRSKQR